MAVQRRDSANPSHDVGPWKNVETKFPYWTWHKESRQDRVAAVLVADTSPTFDGADYWAHAELYRRTGGSLELVPRADVNIGNGDEHGRVVEQAKRWMEANPAWNGSHGRYAEEPANRAFNFGGEFW